MLKFAFLLFEFDMKQADSLQRFIFEHADIRGEMVHLDDAYQTIMKQHPYPDEVKKLLGEVMVASVLLTGSIKFEGEISIQFNGDSRLPMMVAQCDHELNIRAFAKYQPQDDGGADSQSIDYRTAFLQGKLVLTINQHKNTNAYQSIVPIESTSMSENLMHYFAQSEQLSTLIRLAASEKGAAGMMIQLMPGQDTSQKEAFWEYATVIGDTLTEDELLNLSNEALLHRLYHETELRLYDRRAIQFRCRCNPDKMKKVLTILGQKDLEALLAEQGHVEMRCDFCNQSYRFDPIDVTMLFK